RAIIRSLRRKDAPDRGRACRGGSLRAAGRERRASARLRRDASGLARDPSVGISADRLRGDIVATRVLSEGGCGAAPAPSRCGALRHRPDILVPQRTVDASAGRGRGGPDAVPHGSRSPTYPGVFRRRGRFSLGQLPYQHRRGDRRVAAGNTVRPTYLRLQPATLERRNIRHAPREDTPMVRCFSCLLTLAILLCGLVPAAWATGPLGPEISFFSRSGQDPVDDLAFFRGRLGIRRPTFTDNRLYAAYRIMLGGRFSEAQAKQLLAPCCGAPETPFDEVTSWNDLRKRVPGVPPAKEAKSFRQRPEDMRVFDVSCLPNAYRNSAATLRARIAEHGANSPLLRDWVIGQDAVLLNCDADAALPNELPNAPPWLKADRAYQIAAAYFYRLDYARAGQLFAAIGRDASSPWQKTA